MDETKFKECLLSFEKEQSVPVIIRKPTYLDKAEWIYPNAHLNYLKGKWDIKVNRKTERAQLLKKLLDLFIGGLISIPSVHVGFILLYGTSLISNENYTGHEVTEKKIGRKRLEVLAKIPEMRILDNDEFIAYQYQQMLGDNEKNPVLNGVRILFSPDMFDKIFGRTYTDSSIKWIEPISGQQNLNSYLWISDTERRE
ncbi:MAG: hypothetical protein Q8934_08765 [Bacillota bacterium]|nr:hypothetical protein [Bacillota bacterium]